MQSDIAKALTAVGLEPALYQHRRIKDLSSGENDGSLGQYPVMAPRVLIMDEPLVGLDYSGRRQLIRYLVELNRHQGITVIMVTREIRPVYPTVPELFS